MEGTIEKALEEKEEKELEKEFPKEEKYKPLTKERPANQTTETPLEHEINEALVGKSQNFKNTYDTYNGAQTTDDTGAPIDKKTADADYHSKNSRGETIPLEKGQHGPVTMRIGDL